MSDVLLVHPNDDMVVALRDLEVGQSVQVGGETIEIREPIPAKHKFARYSVAAGQCQTMYGITVGRTVAAVQAGTRLTVQNLQHAVDSLQDRQAQNAWQPPNIEEWQNQQFQGYHRPDGRVGVRNIWLVVPLVFCQNRNVDVIRQALQSRLGYSRPDRFESLTERLIQMHRSGAQPSQILESDFTTKSNGLDHSPIFENVDGVKFLTHESGCGGPYEDAQTLCGLLAGYMNHPNVAGTTVLSLGCQKSTVAALQDELHKRNSNYSRPVYILEQQQIGTEQSLLEQAIKHTFAGMVQANQLTRQPAALSQLAIGVECGGSDGFSGLSANPAIGACSDLVVALGGRVILSEFPELAGCENELVARCSSAESAERFLQIMQAYSSRAQRDGGGFDQNPSPGNVADGLITDAMKSAGAARKGGTSPIMDVLDYPEPATKAGLNLLCTPGGDVESTTAMAGSGATIQLFSTGLGTPTGNPVSPVIKVSSNSQLVQRMPDLIDVDAGGIITGQESIESMGQKLLQMIIATANGDYTTKAESLQQDDFIPWRRGISI